MDIFTVLAWVVLLTIVGGTFFWWLLITTEGMYLDKRIVIWLYDIYARRYDKIKNYEPAWEAATLGRPLVHSLIDIPRPLILDVATGTARLPLTVLKQRMFKGEIIGVDYSRRMLAIGAEKLLHFRQRVTLIHQNAQFLPFDDNSFDAVTCLEALEFTPNPDAVMAEIVRVARPGAVILVTNRKGFDAKLMPGRTMLSQQFAQKLREKFGLEDVRVTIWQMDYDQIWAVKPGNSEPVSEHAIEKLLRCPHCGDHNLIRVAGTQSGLRCMECEALIRVSPDNIIEYAESVNGNVTDKIGLQL